LYIGCTIVYVFLIFHYFEPFYRGDELRYVTYAQNLLSGFFSPPAPDFNLWSGPGYPLVLAPFVLLGFSHFQLVLLNVVFLILTLVLTRRSIGLFLPPNVSFLFLLFLGLYFPISKHIYFVHTECFTWFLVSGICYVLVRLISARQSLKLCFYLSLLLAYLVMVKVIFGYVLMVVFILTLLHGAVKRSAKSLKQAAVFATAFVFCLPWLVYTYSITGRALMWTNCSSLSLYTMSTSYDGEYGDWIHPNLLAQEPEHHRFVSLVMTKKPLQQFDMYQDQAIENIKKNPSAYVKNWFFNVSRMLFEYPNNKRVKVGLAPLKSAIPLLILLPAIFSMISLHLKRRNEISTEISAGLLTVIVYLFGCSLVSAMERMFFITLPFWMVYIAYFWKFYSVSFKSYLSKLSLS